MNVIEFYLILYLIAFRTLHFHRPDVLLYMYESRGSFNK